MKSRMLIKMKSALFMLFLLQLASLGRVWAHENNLVDKGDDVETVYLFSYACPTCRLMSPYMMAFDKAFPGIMKLPVHSEKKPGDIWGIAARRAFLLKTLHRDGLLSASARQIDNIGYAVQDDENEQLADNKASFISSMSSWGIQYTEAQLDGPWKLSQMYMQDSNLMLERVRRELGRVGTPIIRVSSPLGVDYIAISADNEDPPMDFLTRAADAIKKHKKHSLQISSEKSKLTGADAPASQKNHEKTDSM